MSHTVDVTTTDFTWDVARGLPVVLQDGTNTYVYGLDLIAAIDGAGVETYFTYDGLGSTADLTDDTDAVTDTYTYDVFGAATHIGSSSNYWQFTGEQEDSSEGLYYLRARYYDPATGRFLGQDPLGIGNGYSYVMNNPVRFVDPSGLCHQELGYDQICNMVHYMGDKEGGFVPPYIDFDFDNADSYICFDRQCTELPTLTFWLCGTRGCTNQEGFPPPGIDCGRDLKYDGLVCGERPSHNWFDDLVIDRLDIFVGNAADFFECQVYATAVGGPIIVAIVLGTTVGWGAVVVAGACAAYAVLPPGGQISP